VFKKIKKRDGRIVKFEPEKITKALAKAGAATREFDFETAQVLTRKVFQLAQEQAGQRKKKTQNKTPSVEKVQDLVEQVLLSSPYRKTAKAYIIYREQHAGIRELTAKANTNLVDQYLKNLDWQVNENSNMTFSLQGLNNYVSSEISKIYWLRKIYPPEIREAHTNGDFHIHDLNLIAAYCIGWDLFDLLVQGFRGAPGKTESKPPRHFRTALGQIVNFFYTLQGEAAGAMAFSNFDTLLSPFIRYDHLNYEEVKQALQEFVFNMNVPTRVGFQTPFTNVTHDLTVPKYFADRAVVVGGGTAQSQSQSETYSDFQDEMDLFNRAFLEVMAEGDAKSRVFSFPIPTYSITKDFDWENGNLELLWEVTAKFGVPYFSNYVNSDMNPEDARSMCCRLRIDNRELRKRGGGLFASNPLTGSVGVVTINMPRLGYLARHRGEDAFLESLGRQMELAKESLEIKRKVLEKFTDEKLYPYTRFYLRGVKERFGEYWKNHFSTIGLLGMNEACLNLFGSSVGKGSWSEGIASESGRRFTLRVLDFMRERLVEFQEETGNNFNLEATPAEGSLAPEEEVLISQGAPRFSAIGPLVDGYFELEDKKGEIQQCGCSEVLKLPEGELFSYGFSRRRLKIKKYPVTALVRHPGKSMFEVTTESGRKVRVTGEHSLFTLSPEGAPESILVRNLREGEVVAVPKRVELEECCREFNLIETFKNSESRKKGKFYALFPADFVEDLISNQRKGSRVKEWCEKNYRLAWKNVKYQWRKSRKIPLKLIYDLEIFEAVSREVLKQSRIFYRTSKNTSPINALIPANRDLGFVVGALLSCLSSEGQSSFCNTDKEFTHEFTESLERVFGPGLANVQIKNRDRKRIYEVSLSKSLSLFFKEVGLEGGSNKKLIPNFVFASSKECVSGLLRGFFLGGGSVYRDFSVRLYTNSKKLAGGLNLCLLKLGILARLSKDKKSERNPNWNDNFVISITGADNLKQFFWEVLKEKLEITKGREVLPEVPRLIKAVLEKNSLNPSQIEIDKDSFNRNLRKNRISAQYFRKILQKLSDLGKSEETEKLQNLLNSDIYWDAVKSVKKLTAPKFVYDFEVDAKNESVQNFLGGEGLVCLHNTSYRLARKDKKKFRFRKPGIICANEAEWRGSFRRPGAVRAEPFYTNSTQLPVNFTDDLFEALDLQDEFQSKYTGGTVFHIFAGERVKDPTAVKVLVRRICKLYRLPYFSFTPSFSVCPTHAYIAGEHFTCPKCGAETEVYSRVVGYLRPVKQWNKGKQAEFSMRRTFRLDENASLPRPSLPRPSLPRL